MKEYSVYRFIKEDLGMSVSKFCKENNIPQSNLSSFKTRNTTVGSLSIDLLSQFVASSNLTYEEVIKKLMSYEIEREVEQITDDEDGQSDFNEDFSEAGIEFGKALKKYAKQGQATAIYTKLVKLNKNDEQFIQFYLQVCSDFNMSAYPLLVNSKQSDKILFLMGASQSIFSKK